MSWEASYLSRAVPSERVVYRVGSKLIGLGAFIQRWAVRETNRREERARPVKRK